MYLTHTLTSLKNITLNPLNSQTDKSDSLETFITPQSLLSLRRLLKLHMTTEHVPIGRNVQQHQRKHFSFQAGKSFFQIIGQSLKNFYFLTVMSDLHGSWKCALGPGVC